MITSVGFLTDVSYITVGGHSVPTLTFNNPDSNENWMVSDPSFFPYFYVRKTDKTGFESLKARIRNAANQHGIRVRNFGEGTLKYHGTPTPVLGVELFDAGDVATLRDAAKWLPGVREIHEADIRYATVYIKDKGLIPGRKYRVTYNDKHTLVELELVDDGEHYTPRAMALDIEVVTPDGSFPNSKRDPIIIISISTTQPTEWGQDFALVVPNADHKITHPNAVQFHTEEQMLRALVAIVAAYNPVPIVTYNGDKFDLEYITDRLAKYGLDPTFGIGERKMRLRPKVSRQGRTNEVSIPGRLGFDMFKVVKRDYDNITIKLGKLEIKGGKDLKTVSEFMGVAKKEDREMLSPDEMREVWRTDPDRFIRYAIDDTKSTLGLYEMVRAQQFAWSDITHQLLQDTVSCDRSGQAEHYFFVQAKQCGELIPNKQRGNSRMGAGTGGYVGEPVKGLHESMLMFDFTSMYPTIVIQNNLGPDTYIPPEHPDWYREDNITVPGLPHKFYHPSVRKSFVAEKVQELLVRRGEVKKQAKAAREAGNEALAHVLDEQQYVIKVLANTGCFGYIGWPQSRWFHRPTSESITAFGREFIGQVNVIGEEFDLMYVYNDTDSYMAKERGRKIDPQEFVHSVNTRLPIKLAFERRTPLAFFTKAKRYFYLKDDGSIAVKGLEVRRTDWCRFAQKAQAAVIEAIMETKDTSRVIEVSKQLIRQVKEGKVPLDELVIRKGLSQDAEDYDNVMIHTAAIQKELDEFGSSQYSMGDKVPVIIANLGYDQVTKNAVTLDYFRKKGLSVNTEYYMENQVLAAVSRITNVLGVDHDVLMGRPAQKKLTDLFGDKEERDNDGEEEDDSKD